MYMFMELGNRGGSRGRGGNRGAGGRGRGGVYLYNNNNNIVYLIFIIYYHPTYIRDKIESVFFIFLFFYFYTGNSLLPKKTTNFFA